METVFLSYARTDESLARVVVEALTGAGLVVHWDRLFEPGEDFGSKIAGLIESSDSTVVLWTPASSESIWVKAEAQLALERDVLVPIAVGIDQTALPLPFSVLHTVSGTNGSELGTVVVNAVFGRATAAQEAAKSAKKWGAAVAEVARVVNSLPPDVPGLSPSVLLRDLESGDEEHSDDEPLRLAVVGEHNKGKSTLLNRILGQDLLPTDTIPTTALPIRVTYSPIESAWLTVTDASGVRVKLPVPLQLLDDYTTISNLAEYSLEPQIAEVEVPIEVLKFIEIIDMPGVREALPREELVRGAVGSATLVIFATDARSPLRGPEGAALGSLLSSGDSRPHRPVGVSLMFGDATGPAEHYEIVDSVTARVASLAEEVGYEGVPPVFLLSSRGGEPFDDEFARLRRWLNQCATNRERELRASVRRRLLDRIMALDARLNGLAREGIVSVEDATSLHHALLPLRLELAQAPEVDRG
ncbi:MAG: dynamin family protein [Actinomycetota bacterium]